MSKLTVRGIQKSISDAVDAGKSAMLWDDEYGLGLKIRGAKSIAWVQRSVVGGKRRDVGLGPYSVGPDGMTLARARERARALSLAARDGVDLVAQEAAAAAAEKVAVAKAALSTFRSVSLAAAPQITKALKNEKDKARFVAILETHVFPILGDRPISSITRGDVMDLVDVVEAKKRETARKLWNFVKRVFEFAEDRQLIAATPLTRPRSFNRKPDQSAVSLPAAMVPAFITALQTKRRPAPSTLCYLSLLPALALRPSELRTIVWSDLDLDAGVLAIPADRMKMGQRHRVPLAPQVVAVLRAHRTAHQAVLTDFVFGAGPGLPPPSDTALRKVARSILPEFSTIDLHGFRATFRTWVGDETDFDFMLAEAALAHSPGGIIATYDRGDKFDRRREMMNAWADHVYGGAGQVVEFIRKDAASA